MFSVRSGDLPDADNASPGLISHLLFGHLGEPRCTDPGLIPCFGCGLLQVCDSGHVSYITAAQARLLDPECAPAASGCRPCFGAVRLPEELVNGKLDSIMTYMEARQWLLQVKLGRQAKMMTVLQQWAQ